MKEARPFEFDTEFTKTGEVLSGAKPAYKRLAEVEAEVQQARADTQAAVMASVEARIATALETIAANLIPVEQVVTQIAEKLRNEAIELSIAASKTISGRALDENGQEAAVEAVAEACNQLKSEPSLIVSLSPEAEAAVKLRLENLPHIASKVHFVADPTSRPGDWRIEFAGGATEFSRDNVSKAVEDCLNRRQVDPVEDQLDLFGAA